MKIITSTQYNRPHHVKKFAESLSRCNGISEYTLLCHVDPSDELHKVMDILHEIDFCKTIIKVNDRRLGVDVNTAFVLKRGFDLSEYVIHVESDCTLCRDALKFYEHCDKYRCDESIFSISAYGRRFHPSHPAEVYEDIDSINKLIRSDSFSGVTFATWKDRWMYAINQWIDGSNVFLGTPVPGCGWDIRMHSIVQKGRCEIFPLVSRANHIGLDTGVNNDMSEERRQWYYDYTYAKVTSDNFFTHEVRYHE